MAFLLVFFGEFYGSFLGFSIAFDDLVCFLCDFGGVGMPLASLQALLKRRSSNTL